MNFFKKIFGSRKITKIENLVPEQAVLVHFTFGNTDLSRLFVLEEQLEKVITSAGVGEYDGNEIAADGSDGILYMYGPDANALFNTIRSTLESTDFMRGARVQLRFGPPEEGVPEENVVLRK